MSAPGLVVVGAGLAGLRAVEAARGTGFTGSVVLVGTEAEDPYDRPPLSKTFLTEGAEVRRLHTVERLRDELDVELRLGAHATALHPGRGEHGVGVVTVDGADLPYGALVVATGSTPRTLPGLPAMDGVLSLRTHEDAQALREALRPGTRVVVVGAGFIGSELASSAAAVGAEVTVLEAAPVPLVRAVGPEMGAALAGLHRRHGVDLRCGVVVESLTGDGHVTGVRLGDGQVLPADLVVVGVGASPSLDWLAGSGVEVADGVVCDETLASSRAGVWAAGDVARWVNPLFGTSMRLEHWTAAAELGGVAGHNAVTTGESQVCSVVPYFWSDWGSDRIQFVGVPQADEVRVVADDTTTGGLLALYRTGDRVTGALGVNQRRPVTRVRMMIAARAGWDEAVEAAEAAATPRPPSG